MIQIRTRSCVDPRHHYNDKQIEAFQHPPAEIQISPPVKGQKTHASLDNFQSQPFKVPIKSTTSSNKVRP